jgi:hypothetical protein
LNIQVNKKKYHKSKKSLGEKLGHGGKIKQSRFQSLQRNKITFLIKVNKKIIRKPKKKKKIISTLRNNVTKVKR